MSQYQSRSGSKLWRTLKKFVVSAFVICSFVAYALHEHFAGATNGSALIAPPSSPITTQAAPSDPSLVLGTNPPTRLPAAPTRPPIAPRATATPRLVPTATPKSNGQYRDGQYTGTEVDAFYGYVRVKAVIRDGKIADVQFLEYPNDRRTSVRINSTVMPWLQQEAIQAQSARVDIISGATLTSEAFMQSLQSALNAARS